MATSQKNEPKNRLTNYMEELAGSILGDLLLLEYKHTRFNPSNLEDIKALALNRLWPMYTTTPEGRDYLQKTVIEEDIEKDIARELRAAISIVASNPKK